MWLWGSLTASSALPSGVLQGRRARIDLAQMASASALSESLGALRGRTVLVATKDPLAAALTLIELDGVARRMVLCPPDLSTAHLPAVIRDAAADACVFDSDGDEPADIRQLPIRVRAHAALSFTAVERNQTYETEWILLTSGTTGAPKLVLHTHATLVSAFATRERPAGKLVWSTFYDIRRYGGLQVYLRALYHGSLVLSDAEESTADFLARLAAAGATHISGTPSHWRRALMSGAASGIAPSYVRLSGEIADQPLLDALQAAFPNATVGHAFASTEAGVGFEVRDGKAGFPAALVNKPQAGVEIDVSGGTLRLRSQGNAKGYLGAQAPALKDPDGFVDTTDRVELREGRYVFMGRNSGVINVGGLKVHPEEVEAIINTHPRVRMSLVKSRRSPITGAIVTADVVLAETADTDCAPDDLVKREILDACRSSLAAHKVPAAIRIVAALDITEAGKLVRSNA